MKICDRCGEEKQLPEFARIVRTQRCRLTNENTKSTCRVCKEKDRIARSKARKILKLGVISSLVNWGNLPTPEDKGSAAAKVFNHKRR